MVKNGINFHMIDWGTNSEQFLSLVSLQSIFSSLVQSINLDRTSRMKIMFSEEKSLEENVTFFKCIIGIRHEFIIRTYVQYIDEHFSDLKR